jgi:hypothetical protein
MGCLRLLSDYFKQRDERISIPKLLKTMDVRQEKECDSPVAFLNYVKRGNPILQFKTILSVARKDLSILEST